MASKPWQELTPARIRALREVLGVSQAEFGMLIGQEARSRSTADGIVVSLPDQGAISRWEVGPGELYGKAILALEEREQRVGKFEEEARGGK